MIGKSNDCLKNLVSVLRFQILKKLLRSGGVKMGRELQSPVVSAVNHLTMPHSLVAAPAVKLQPVVVSARTINGVIGGTTLVSFVRFVHPLKILLDRGFGLVTIFLLQINHAPTP